MTAFDLLLTRNIPEHIRFSGFTTPHYIYLLAAALYICTVAILAKRAGAAKREKMLVFFTWALPCVYLFRFTVFFLLDVFVEPQTTLLDRLPIHLCTMNAIIMPLAVFSKNKYLLNFIYAVSIPGAASAMLTPAMSYYGWYFYMGWHVSFFFLDHATMLLVPILAIISGRLRPDIKTMPKAMAVFLSYAGVIYIIDKLTGENLLFLNWPDEGTLLSLMADYLGNPGYIGGLAGLTAVIIILMYLPWIIAARRGAKYKSIQ